MKAQLHVILDGAAFGLAMTVLLLIFTLINILLTAQQTEELSKILDDRSLHEIRPALSILCARKAKTEPEAYRWLKSSKIITNVARMQTIMLI